MPFGAAIAEWIRDGFPVSFGDLMAQWHSAIDDTGYGDYIALTIDENGYINDWPDEEDIKYQMDEFLDGDDE